MDTTLPPSSRATRLALGGLALVLAAVLLLAAAPHALADGGAVGDVGSGVVLAAEERERRPIAPTQRDQLGLVLYGLMALGVLAGGVTLRRQLRGERPQSDGEFRWR